MATVALVIGLAGCRRPESYAPKSFQTTVLSNARQVVVVGDSISYDGHWIEFVQAGLIRAGHPARRPFIDVALPSETVSGLSEPGHAGGKFPRPDLHERLDRVLAKTKPDVVLACYGENDGIYKPFSQDRFNRYKSGIAWLRARVAQAGAKLILMTPPGFDPEPIATKVVPEGKEDATHFFEGYDQVLGTYAAWLLTLRSEGVTVIDVHAAVAHAIKNRRKLQPTFSFTKDGVHPNPAGHLVIAEAVLSGLGFRPSEAVLPDSWAAVTPPTTVSLLREQNTLLKDAWLTSTGHTRPGMHPGLPLPEAMAKADALQSMILPVP